jgi:ABC-type transport system substrate-binding protein
VDIMRLSSIDTLEQILDTNEDTSVYRVPSFGWAGYAIWLPLDQAPYNDKRVRQALSMAIDRRVVLEVVNRSDASMYGPFPWALAGFTEFSDYNLSNLGPAFQYNPEEAKRLLDEAVPGGLKLDLEWGELQGFPFGDFAVLVSKYWEDIGVEVDLKQLESGTWQSKRRGGADVDNPMLSLVNTGSGPTAWDWVYAPYHSSLPDTINRPHVDDPKVDGLLDEWVSATSDRQLEIQKELFKYLGDQTYRIHTMVPPHYAIAQPYLIRAGNPYCWFPGFCSYEAKTAWMTNDRPDRKFEKFGQ